MMIDTGGMKAGMNSKMMGMKGVIGGINITARTVVGRFHDGPGLHSMGIIGMMIGMMIGMSGAQSAGAA